MFGRVYHNIALGGSLLSLIAWIALCICLHTESSSTAARREADAYLAERNKYKQRSEQRAKKGSAREEETLKMLAAFQSKMERSRRLAEYVTAGVADDVEEEEEDDTHEGDTAEDDDTNDLTWSVHRDFVHGLFVLSILMSMSVCLSVCLSVSVCLLV